MKAVALNPPMMKPRGLRWLRGLGTAFVALLVLIGALQYFLMYLPVRANVIEIQQCAEKGSHENQYILGVSHLTGMNESRSLGLIRKDNQKAVAYLGAAARGGYVKAYAPYAVALEKADRKADAKPWWDKASEKDKAVWGNRGR